MKIIQCDYLIIGSGAGGSVVADYLVECGFSVLMIEEGNDYSGYKNPKTASAGMTGMWRGGGLTPAFGSPSITYAEGRCLGGGTEINSGIMQRVPDSVLDSWAGISRDDNDFYKNKIDHYYDWVEKTLSANIKDQSQAEHSQILKEAGQNKGWKVESLPRAIKDCICNQPLCFCGAKQSMTSTLLRKHSNNPKFKIITGAKANKLIFKKDKITAVMVKKTSKDFALEIRIEPLNVFLCAGSIHSPHLLMKSGINFAGLGKFQLHPTLKILAHYNEPVNAARQPIPNVAITEFMPDIRFGGSVASPGVIGMALAENWNSREKFIHSLDNLASYYVMIKPKSWGQIKSFKFLKDPLVTYNLNSYDFDQILFGAKKLASALFSTGALSLHPSIKNHMGWQDIESVSKDIKNKKINKKINLMSIHLFSSCSPFNNQQYLLSNGRLNGLNNLVLADGSCLPSAPGVNPQATIMALARRNVKAYLGDSL